MAAMSPSEDLRPKAAKPRNAVVILLDSLNRHMLGAYGGKEFSHWREVWRYESVDPQYLRTMLHPRANGNIRMIWAQSFP